MLRPMINKMAFVLIIMCAICPSLHADDWQWPSQMTVGGFSVTAVKGNAAADGSGSASGKLQIPIVGVYEVSLNRSSRGEITGRAPVKGRIGGLDIDGIFSLAANGLKGTGTIKNLPGSVVGATLNIDSKGQMTGKGSLTLKKTNIDMTFNISGSSINLSGSADVHAQQDMPLALYDFRGNLKLSGSPGKLDAVANGQVQRKGKLANQVSSYKISNAAVNVVDGKCVVNVGGVNVTFDLL